MFKQKKEDPGLVGGPKKKIRVGRENSQQNGRIRKRIVEGEVLEKRMEYSRKERKKDQKGGGLQKE